MRRSNKLRKQNSVFLALAAGFIIIFGGISWFLVADDHFSGLREKQALKMDLPSDKINGHDLWIDRVEKEGKDVNSRLKKLEGIIEEQKITEKENLDEKERLRDEITKLKEKIEILPEEIAYREPEYPVISTYTEPLSTPIEIVQPLVLEEYVFEEDEEDGIVKNVDFTIPSGTTVKALLVSSVDAPCSVYASNDPQPVKLRILDNGHLPHDVNVKLKGSLIIASAFGNLSSERLYVRLERMTQVKPNGNFVETDVVGFVSGEDGKYGIRGVMVDRSGTLLKNATISGFFGGVGQYLQATINSQNIANATQGLPNDLKWDIVKQSTVSGVSNAMEKLADYYLKRADQLVPVVQVAAGRTVDITFTRGTEVGSLHVKDEVRADRERSRQNG